MAPLPKIPTGKRTTFVDTKATADKRTFPETVMKNPTIDAKQAIEDIHSGMGDVALMEKYGISAKGLESLFKKLLMAGILSRSEFDKRIRRPESTIEIDLSQYRLLEKAPEQVTLREEEGKCVLAISNDERFLQTFHDAFSDRRFRMVAFKTEVPNAESFLSLTPNLVLLDMSFHGINHAEILQQAKEFDDTLPVILVTLADHGEEALERVGDAVYDHLEKPVHHETLRKAIDKGLEYGDLVRFKRDHLKLMEDAIQEKTMDIVRTKDFLQGILNSSTLVSVVLTDLDQNVLFWNTGAENIFGYTSDEIVGKKITKLYPPDSLSKETVEQLRRLVKRRTGTVQGKMKQIAKDGRPITVSLAISPMVNEFGDLQGILGVGLDVTEEARQQREIIRLLNQVKKTQDVSIFTLAKLAESRDEETGYHLTRIQKYCRLLCEGLAESPRFQDVVTQRFSDDLYQSSVLHDIGKVAIPDSILLSTEKFGPEERKIMERHPVVGGRALEEAVKILGEASFLTVGMEVAYYHHEHWDGSGYPFGLKGEEIPLSARIVAIADVYDALTAKRRYKRAFSHEEACSIIVENRGKQFDPHLVEVFQELDSDFWSIRSTFTLA
jgi:PAS domain S-box-containing protein